MAILDYEYDAETLPIEVKRGLDFLYEAVDRKAACAAWADCFSKDNFISMNGVTTTGIPAAQERLEKRWATMDRSVHVVEKVSVARTTPLTLNINGTLQIRLINGEEKNATWTGEQIYVEEDGRQKIAQYTVNLIFHD
ncbi:hypothetical protein PT974_07709 [Cladobotryum mycophilum]|uniref:SnoaL-like domain-containing protein n=1 Tax=Cladobotryum mycophilum TaxID=491253 RepID=A0ABR0SHR8_9HYPO